MIATVSQDLVTIIVIMKLVVLLTKDLLFVCLLSTTQIESNGCSLTDIAIHKITISSTTPGLDKLHQNKQVSQCKLVKPLLVM